MGPDEGAGGDRRGADRVDGHAAGCLRFRCVNLGPFGSLSLVSGGCCCEAYRLELTCGAAGLYFGAKAAEYFAVGKITKDQVVEYGERKGMPAGEAERWLGSSLSYAP